MLHISAHGDPIHDANGQFTGYRGTARDISVHKQAAQRIQYLSTHDELTGLPNRAALRQLVTQAIELAKRYERCFAVLLLNVDRFQRMNDSLGREVGDALLRELGARMKKQLAPATWWRASTATSSRCWRTSCPRRSRPNRSRASCSMR